MNACWEEAGREAKTRSLAASSALIPTPHACGLRHFGQVHFLGGLECGPPGSSVHGILQVRILEWVAVPSSSGSSQRRDQTHISDASCIGRWVLYHQHHLETYPHLLPKQPVWLPELTRQRVLLFTSQACVLAKCFLVIYRSVGEANKGNDKVLFS